MVEVLQLINSLSSTQIYFEVSKGDIDTGGYPFVFTSSTGHNQDMRFWNGFIQKFFINNASYLEFEPNTADPNSRIGFIGIEI